MDFFANLFGPLTQLFDPNASAPDPSGAEAQGYVNLFSQDPDQGHSWLSKAFPNSTPPWAPWHPEYEYRTRSQIEEATKIWDQQFQGPTKYVSPSAPEDPANLPVGAAPGSFRASQETGMSLTEEVRVSTGPRVAQYERPDYAEIPTWFDQIQHTKLEGVVPEVKERFGKLQHVMGRSFWVNSGYRDPAKNSAVGGAKRSQHLHGNALDIDVSDMTPAERVRLIAEASALGFTGIGVYENSIHLDAGERRSWGPSHGRESVPRWAEPAVRKHLNGEFSGRMNLGMKPPDPTKIAAYDGPIKVTGGNIDPVSFVSVAAKKIENSRLVGFVPKDGEKFGIKTGSAEEWARFFAALTKQESGFRVAKTAADGSLVRFRTTPAGEKSFGPGQFNIGEYGLKSWADVNDPARVIDAYIAVASRFTLKSGYIKNGLKGMDAYFGSIRRPNEVLQHLDWAYKIGK